VTCDWEPLEALALGELDGAALPALQRHLQACEPCTSELRLLRQERQLLRARQTPPMPRGLWRSVLARTPARPIRGGRAWMQPLALAAALALAVLVGHPAAKVTPGGSCGGPSRQGDEIRLAESDFNACLVATPSGEAALYSCCF